MSQNMSDPEAWPPREQLLVVHANGESRFDTNYFAIDDKSSVLMVFSDDPDPKRRRTLAAFDREFWVHASFVPVWEEVPDGDG